MPDISVIIPTFRRPAKLAACLRHLAAQDLDPARFEVLVGLDGPDDLSAHAATEAWSNCPARLTIRALPKLGLAAVRNALLPDCRGRILLSTNDDVLADPTFLSAHIQAHAQAHQDAINNRRGVIVGGYSPWSIAKPDRAFDRLIRETSMVFFWDRMIGPDSPGAAHPRDHDWGFRHAWGLNMSMPTDAVRALGGFVVLPAKYGYEDNEIAWRLAQSSAMPVLFRPEALAIHDHRMNPREYLEREYKLGFAAWGFAHACTDCAAAMFRRDLRAATELEDCRAFTRDNANLASRLAAELEATTRLPAGHLTPAETRRIYDAHLPLKRWCWRSGLLDAAEGRELDTASLEPLALAAPAA